MGGGSAGKVRRKEGNVKEKEEQEVTRSTPPSDRRPMMYNLIFPAPFFFEEISSIIYEFAICRRRRLDARPPALRSQGHFPDALNLAKCVGNSR